MEEHNMEEHKKHKAHGAVEDKDQVHKEHHHKHGKYQSKNHGRLTTVVMMGLVILLLVVSVVQSVQITTLQENIASGDAKVYPSTQKVSQPSPASPPAMVGGC